MIKKILAFSFIFCFSLSLLIPVISLAENEPCTTGPTGALKYCALEPEAFKDFGGAMTAATTLGDVLAQAFQFGLALAAALAVIMIVWGGAEIMLSEAVTKKEDGKKRVWDAIWGLLLALSSWLILYIINPEILKFKF